MSVPPEVLMGMLGGGGGPPPGMGGPPMMGPPPQEQSAPPSSAQFLKDVIEHLSGYQDVEKDPEDLAAYAKIVAQLRQLAAKQQKEQDAAFGAGPATKVLRRG